MTARERFHAVMSFQPFDRLPIVEWAIWWDRTIARWHGEGLPGSLTDRYDLNRYFGQDVWMQDWVSTRKPGFVESVPVASLEDYERVRPHLLPRPAIDPRTWERWADAQSRGEVVLWFTVEGFFWFARSLLGVEEHLLAFYDKPELLHRINEDLAEWLLQVIDEICAVCTPDFMTFGEDMSYNHGPMLSQPLFSEFMAPYYAVTVSTLKDRGIWTVIDSDGDVSLPAAWFEASGLDGILPLERQAGVDIAALRAAHPRMRFIGHYDKMVMPRGEAAMRAEFERLLPVAARGGFIPSVDHQTPPGVSLDEYRLFMRLFGEYAEEAGRLSRAAG